MDLRKLRYFVGVVEAGGFRRAAKLMNIAQPALSRHIRELETEVGLKLLDRGRNGIGLTSDGERFIVRCRDVIESFEKLMASAGRPEGSLKGSVRIGAPSAIAAYIFGPLAQRLHDSHPEIHLKCITDTVRVMDLLASNELDLGVVTLVDGHETGANWLIDKLAFERDCLVGPKGSLDPARPVSFNFVMDLPLVLTPMPHSRRGHMQKLAAASGRKLNVAAEAGAIAAQASFVRQGLGYAVMPYSAASLMASFAPLAIAPIIGLNSWRALVRRADRLPSQPTLIVSNMIRGLFRDGIPSLDGPAEPLLPVPRAS